MPATFITDDIASIFDDGIFTETFSHVNGTTTESLLVQFDDESEEALSRVETSSPVIILPTADAGNIDRASVLTRDADSAVYYPVQISKDDSGITTINLSKNRPT